MVSTNSKEQQHGLQSQIAFYSEYIHKNPSRSFVVFYYDAASGLKTKKRPDIIELKYLVFF